MEENKLIKYNKSLVQHVSDVIGITNKLLKDSPILKVDIQIEQQEEYNNKLKAMLLMKKQVMKARQWKEQQLHNSFNFIGSNKKQIVILINELSEEYIQSASMKQLLMILKASKLQLEDVAIINIGKQKIELNKIMNLFVPNVIILFGIKNIDLNSSLNLKAHQILTYEKCKIVIAPPLKILFHLNGSAAWVEKRELWGNLKRVLNM